VFDHEKRFDDAMSAFLQAKALAKETDDQVAARRAGRADLKKTTETVSLELLQRWHQSDETFEPLRKLAVICGYPRSGTTLLEKVLDSHPDILSVEETSIFMEETYMPLGRGHAADAHFMSVLDSVTPGLLGQARKNYFRCAENFLDQP